MCKEIKFHTCINVHVNVHVYKQCVQAIKFSDIAMKNFEMVCFIERPHYNFAWSTDGAMR